MFRSDSLAIETGIVARLSVEREQVLVSAY